MDRRSVLAQRTDKGADHLRAIDGMFKAAEAQQREDSKKAA